MAKQGQKHRHDEHDFTNDRLRSESTSLTTASSFLSEASLETRQITPATTTDSDHNMLIDGPIICKSIEANPTIRRNKAAKLNLKTVSHELDRITATEAQAVQQSPASSLDIDEDTDSDLRIKRKRDDDSEWDEFAETPKPQKRSRKNEVITDENADDFVNLAMKTKRPNARGTGAKRKHSARKPAATAFERQRAAGNMLDDLHVGNVWTESAANANLQPQNTTGQQNGFQSDLKPLVMRGVSREHRRQADKDWTALNESLSQIGGYKKIFGDRLTIRGTNTPLHYYQIVTVGFFLRQEKREDGPRSGIIASHMGLGKTLSALSAIANMPAPGQQRSYKGATLIIAGPALLRQWKREIRDHIVCREDRNQTTSGIQKPVLLQVLMSNATQEDNPAKFIEKELRTADIVLATYNRTLMSFNASKDKRKSKIAGVLHSFEWHRVILDEAHAIKDTNTATFKACSALKTQHVWCITGTPVMNASIELFSYFNLMRHPDATSIRDFKNKYMSAREGQEEQSQKRLEKLLSDYMIRFKHSDTLFNRKLLNLPSPKPPINFYIAFTDAERKIYDRVKSSYVQHSKKLDALDRLTAVRRMLLRLRQLTSHFHYLPAAFDKILDRSDYEAIRAIIANVPRQEDMRASITASCQIAALLTRAGELAKDRTDPVGFSVSLNDLIAPDPSSSVSDAVPLSGSVFGREGMQMHKCLEALETPSVFSKISANTACTICRAEPKEPQRASCDHIFCLKCIAERTQHEAATCPRCKDMLCSYQPCITPVSMLSHTNTVSKTKSAARGRMDDIFSASNMLIPSSKLLAVKAILHHWLPKTVKPITGLDASKDDGPVANTQTDDSGSEPSDIDTSVSDGLDSDGSESERSKEIDEDADTEMADSSGGGLNAKTTAGEETPTKIVLFSQFKGMLSLIAHLCKREGWSYRFYTGDDDLQTRQKCLDQFRLKKNIQILLATLKCGGEGLNLTAASKVLMVEPWWNDAAEQQAFCRVHRIGQTKQCELYRLIIAGSIDDDIMGMKGKKLEDIKQIMTGGSALQAFLAEVQDQETEALAEELEPIDDAHAAG